MDNLFRMKTVESNCTTICHFNIENISARKSVRLSQKLQDYKVDIIALQETHTKSDLDLKKRGHIPGYEVICAIHDEKRAHGIAIYAREALAPYCSRIHRDCPNKVHVLAIRVARPARPTLTVVNVYKPPHSKWPENIMKVFPNPVVYVGDFNSHNKLWGYKKTSKNGKQLLEWIMQNDLQRIFNVNDKGTFFSAIWKKFYNPDLTIVSKNPEGIIKAKRRILGSFNGSQHRPVILNYYD
jgi:Endonuclease-reverse transcriptase